MSDVAELLSFVAMSECVAFEETFLFANSASAAEYPNAYFNDCIMRRVIPRGPTTMPEPCFSWLFLPRFIAGRWQNGLGPHAFANSYSLMTSAIEYVLRLRST